MLKSFKNVANNDYKQQLYILTDHKTNKANGFKDLKSAAISVNVDYRVLKDRLSKNIPLVKDEIYIFEGNYHKSKRGNPNFKG